MLGSEAWAWVARGRTFTCLAPSGPTTLFCFSVLRRGRLNARSCSSGTVSKCLLASKDRAVERHHTGSIGGRSTCSQPQSGSGESDVPLTLLSSVDKDNVTVERFPVFIRGTEELKAALHLLDLFGLLRAPRVHIGSVLGFHQFEFVGGEDFAGVPIQLVNTTLGLALHHPKVELIGVSRPGLQVCGVVAVDGVRSGPREWGCLGCERPRPRVWMNGMAKTNER